MFLFLMTLMVINSLSAAPLGKCGNPEEKPRFLDEESLRRNFATAYYWDMYGALTETKL